MTGAASRSSPRTSTSRSAPDLPPLVPVPCARRARVPVASATSGRASLLVGGRQPAPPAIRAAPVSAFARRGRPASLAEATASPHRALVTSTYAPGSPTRVLAPMPGASRPNVRARTCGARSTQTHYGP